MRLLCLLASLLLAATVSGAVDLDSTRTRLQAALDTWPQDLDSVRSAFPDATESPNASATEVVAEVDGQRVEWSFLTDGDPVLRSIRVRNEEGTGFDIAWRDGGTRVAWFAEYASGRMHGAYLEFFDDGTPSRLWEMREGMRSGVRQEWDGNGNLVIDEIVDPPREWEWDVHVPDGG